MKVWRRELERDEAQGLRVKAARVDSQLGAGLRVPGLELEGPNRSQSKPETRELEGQDRRQSKAQTCGLEGPDRSQVKVLGVIPRGAKPRRSKVPTWECCRSDRQGARVAGEKLDSSEGEQVRQQSRKGEGRKCQPCTVATQEP